MRILLTGGTGLIGQALCQHWQRQGHELWVWSRDPHKVQRLCSGARSVQRLGDLDPAQPFDAVVNLAGAPIANRPWTAARRALLWRSRVELTRQLVDWIGQQPTAPRVLLSASAVGWYGDQGDTLHAEYTYLHEEGNLGYSYRIVWLLLDGREVQTDWMAKESPFIYAVYAMK